MKPVLPILCALIALGVTRAADAAGKADFFESRIRPVLVERCGKCHVNRAEAGLRLTSRENLVRGGESGSAFEFGHPERSLLIAVLKHEHDAIKMPPDDKLPARQIADFERWIADGAVWPRARATGQRATIDDAARTFWSFQPLRRPSVPNAGGPASNPIDAFLQQRRTQEGLKATLVRATPRTLIRRITFDLTGLAPTSDEVERFVRESGEDRELAYQRLVDRLLSSRRYGERWGQHWLDLVRYADTAGDSGDFPIPEAYKYRNYVIESFNKDKPYDEFVREQIAGDLLRAESEEARWEKTVATGYLAIARRVGVSPLNLRHIVLEDVLGNLGTTFLGLSIGCARCHDHKFDPIPTDDYYALYGIFDSSEFPHPGEEHRPWRDGFVYRIGKEKSDAILADHRAELEKWNRRERAAFEEYRDFQRKRVTDPNRSRTQAWQKILRIREERRVFAEQIPLLETAYAIREGQPRDAAVQYGGDPAPRARGPVVRRGFLQVLGGMSLSDDHRGSGRLDLARWLTDRQNPLTARVLVNRLWHHHFGAGLVRTTSDFGVRGERPTHPELLDYLACELHDRNWSVKSMHRLIVTSVAYQLSSWVEGRDADDSGMAAIDPDNRLLWRANRRRLDAEQVRDTILRLCGRLDESPGGRHPFPHRLTYFYRQHEPFVGDFESNRRSVYVMRQRIKKHVFLDLFDGPDGNIPSSERKSTTTTLQALYLMNSETIHSLSEQVADTLWNESDGRNAFVGCVYRAVLGRPATKEESRRVGGFLAADDRAPLARAAFVRAMLSSNEFIYVE